MARFYREVLDLELKPSRMAGALVALLGGTSLGLVAFTGLDLAAQAALAAAVGALSLEAWWRLARRPPTRLVVARSREIQVRDARGTWRQGAIRDGAFVAPWLTLVRWRPAGGWFDRTVLVLPDTLDADDFRALRVLLRWM